MNKKEFSTYIETVEKNRIHKKAIESINESIEVKYRKLDALKESATNKSITSLLFKVYEKALPLSQEYKNAYSNELKEYFENFIDRYSNGDVKSLLEKASNKSRYSKNALSIINEMVSETYNDIAFNIRNTKNQDIVFESEDSESIVNSIDIANKDLNGDELSEIINDNVKKTAISEIQKAKEEKEKLKEFEKELMNDITIDSEEKVEEAVAAKFNNRAKKRYSPSLFESVMINKFDEQEKKMEDGTFTEGTIYNVMESYGKTSSDINDYAFIEAIKEYTGLSILNATKILPINITNIEDIKYNYTK